MSVIDKDYVLAVVGARIAADITERNDQIEAIKAENAGAEQRWRQITGPKLDAWIAELSKLRGLGKRGPNKVVFSSDALAVKREIGEAYESDLFFEPQDIPEPITVVNHPLAAVVNTLAAIENVVIDVAELDTLRIAHLFTGEYPKVFPDFRLAPSSGRRLNVHALAGYVIP